MLELVLMEFQVRYEYSLTIFCPYKCFKFLSLYFIPCFFSRENDSQKTNFLLWYYFISLLLFDLMQLYEFIIYRVQDRMIFSPSGQNGTFLFHVQRYS